MRFITILIIIIQLFLLGCSEEKKKAKPTVEKGVINLKGWDFSEDGNLKLNGQWEFYWKKLLKPDEIDQYKPDYIKVPGSWIKKILNNKNLPKQGYSTYRLKIIIEKPMRLHLYYNPPPTSSKLYLNGETLKVDGKIAKRKVNEIPNEITESISLDLDKNENNLVINLANHSNFGSGLSKELIIGERKKINDIWVKNIAMDLFLAGALFVIGISQLFQFYFRRKNRSSLWLSLLSINIGVRSLLSNERFAVYFFDNIPWHICVRLDILTIPLGIILTIKFFDSLYEKIMHNYIKWFLYFLSFLYSLIVIFFSIDIVSQYLYHYHKIVILSGLYITGFMAWCIYKKKDGALISAVGFIILYTTALFDILISWLIFENIMLTSFGLVIFFIAQSLNLSLGFFKAYTRVEKFSSSMEQIIRMRNEELFIERDELKKRNEIINAELDLAKQIQQQLIPKTAPVNYMSCFYKPMDKVGGDFFEFLKFRDPSRIGIFISDVTGHGVPAAFITSMIKTTILQSGERRNNPAELLFYLNDVLINHTAGNFITAIYAIVNKNTGEIILSNAGHNYPYLISNGKISKVESKRSIPLAVMDNYNLKKMNKNFENSELKIQSGDKLFLYTDGLTEATNNIDYNFFENVKLLEILKSSNEMNCHEMKKNMYNELLKFRGNEDFDDDICMIFVDL